MSRDAEIISTKDKPTRKRQELPTVIGGISLNSASISDLGSLLDTRLEERRDVLLMELEIRALKKAIRERTGR